MPEETLVHTVQPPEQTPDTFSGVLTEHPDMHPDLKLHVERLVAQTGEIASDSTLGRSDSVSPAPVEPPEAPESFKGSITPETQTTPHEGSKVIEVSVPNSPKPAIDSLSNGPGEEAKPGATNSATVDQVGGSAPQSPVAERMTNEEREAAAEQWISEHLITEPLSEEDIQWGNSPVVTLKLKDGETVPPEFGSEIVVKLLDQNFDGQVVDNLASFSGLNDEVANRLLTHYSYAVLDHIDSFRGLQFNRQLADRLLKLGSGHSVIGHIEDFKDITPDAAFASQMVETGNASAVIEHIDRFEGVTLDAAFIEKALSVPGNGSAIARLIDKFPDIEPSDELAQKILSADGPSALIFNLEKFHNLSNATAEKLLVNGGFDRIQVLEHIESFPNLTAGDIFQSISEAPEDTLYGKLGGVSSLPSQMQSDIYALVIEKDGFRSADLKQFSALDVQVAQKLIEQGHIVDVLESMDSFSGVEFDIDFAKQALAHIEGYPGPLLENIQKFPKELHNSLAQLIIDRGYADQLDYLIQVDRIQVDHALAEKIASVRMAGPNDIGAYLAAFPNTDHGVLAQRLTEKRDSSSEAYTAFDLERIAQGLAHLKGLDSSIAEKLLSNGGGRVLAEGLSSFHNLDAVIAERLIADKFVVEVLHNQNVFDNFILTAGEALKLLEEGDDLILKILNEDLMLALAKMDPNKVPVYDTELAHKLIDSNEVGAIANLFKLFESLDADVAKNLIEFHYTELVFDNLQRFTDANASELAKVAINNNQHLEIFKRLDQIEGLTDLKDDGDERVQRFIDLINDKELSSLLGEGGPLHILSGQLVELYMHAENPQLIAGQLKALVSGDTALWRINHAYAKLLIGEVGDVGHLSEYRVSAIPLALPTRDVGTLSADIPKPTAFEDLDADARRMVLSPAFLALHPDIMSVSEVHFTDLNPDFQDALLAYRLYETIATSRDGAAQTQASERNKAFAEAGEYWHLGDLLHATGSVGNLRNILLSGVLCGETIGASTSQDSYPFNVDTVVVSEVVMGAENHENRLATLLNRDFGNIVLLFHRTPESTDFGRETKGGMNEDHRLVFGAMPSTEISAIFMRSSNPEERALVVDAVVESGIYIPIVDETGSVILGFDEYQTRRADGNYISVNPTVLDSSFKRDNSQLGSNEGAMFVIPDGSGVSRYYVKFGDASSQRRDHLWTEILADRIYRAVTPQLVPDTDAVIVEGRLAKASKLVEEDESAQITNEARNAGFIMDAFLGNWDAVYNPDNLVMTRDGRAMRIDTGNGLDFRARGDRKEEGSFGEVVQEVEIGSDNSRLGGGMRQMYPGLTDDEIKAQVEELRDRLPDETIDALVESIRRPKTERVELARILKARRQYLIDKFL